MAIYVIHHKIDTLLELWEPFDHDGFHFSAWHRDLIAGRTNGWLATKQIEADTIENAFRQFSERFFRLVDRIAFVGQCHTTAVLESLLITSSDDTRFFWRHARKRKPVPLHFNKREIESLEVLERYEENGDVFRYLGEATNTASFYPRLAMLVSALEAMAPVIEERGRRRADKKFIATEILGDEELCKKLFQYGDGIRNQILHGRAVNLELHGGENYNETIYEAVIEFFNTNHGLNVNTKAKGTPRTLLGTYEHWTSWCEWRNMETSISLPLLNEKFRADDARQYYEPIKTPDDF